jgi:hypothetical protein
LKAFCFPGNVKISSKHERMRFVEKKGCFLNDFSVTFSGLLTTLTKKRRYIKGTGGKSCGKQETRLFGAMSTRVSGLRLIVLLPRVPEVLSCRQ